MYVRRRTTRITIWLIAITAAALTAGTGAALAKKKPTIHPGKYVTTSGPKFSFTVKKKKCPILPTDPKKKPSTAKKRYCFTGGPEEPRVTVVCPELRNYEQPFSFFLFNRAGFSSTGKMTAIAWTYRGDPNFPDPIGDTTVHAELKGKKASGYLQVRTYRDDGKNCDSGQIAFTAKLK